MANAVCFGLPDAKTYTTRRPPARSVGRLLEGPAGPFSVTTIGKPLGRRLEVSHRATGNGERLR